MANTRSGTATKNALSDALVSMLSDGIPLNRIPIRKITDACNVDRQTFYYHFKNIYELAEYACKNEAAKLFAVDHTQQIEKIPWVKRLEVVMERIEDDPAMRDSIIPALSEAALRKRFTALIMDALNHDLKPRLIAAGFSADEAASSIELLSFTLYAILISWIIHDIEKPASTVISEVTGMVDDYVRGALMRIKG